jgi:hypothetical protein
MMKRLTSVLSILILQFLSFSCQPDESLPSTLGKATFSLSPQTRNNGRISGTATPAFVLLSVKDSEGKAQENIKLPLYSLGQSYLSENLELEIGAYQLSQFVVLDATNKIIYATPLEGSDLAKYVSDPLPMEFSVDTDGTQVIPQVLAVLEDDKPESFGLASFGFEIVNLLAFQIPSVGAEKILKVSYEFSNGTETITGEGVPVNSIVDLSNTVLQAKSWDAKIVIWIEPRPEDLEQPCYQVSPYQKVYRFEGTVTFDGSLKRLPSFTNGAWRAFYRKEVYYGFDKSKSLQLFFPADPRRSFLAEVHSQSPVYASVDRSYYDQEGNSICDLVSDSKSGNSRIQIHLPDQTDCEEDNEFGVLGLIDSFFIVNVAAEQMLLTFYWKVDTDGSVKPQCFGN